MALCERPLSAFILLAAALLLFSANARCQSAESVLSKLDEGYLDSLASNAAQKIRKANLDEKEPKVLVIDFFRGSPGNSSKLGTVLADRFSESLAAYSKGMRILDRKILRDYLIKEWTTLEDLQSNDVCLRIGRQLGATGVILGTVYEENGQLSLTVHFEGFGPIGIDKDGFSFPNERIRFPVTEEIHAMLFQPGPNYARKAEDIPEEPDVFKSSSPGVTAPKCTYCPDPDYSDAARASKFQGTVILSVVVTAEGQAKSVFVLKGAPFGLTAQAIKALQSWRFEPAMKDGKPVSVRVQTETTFSLF